MEVSKEIAALFKCPLCRYSMRPPIRVCDKGLSICNTCAKSIFRGRPHSHEARNYSLERLHDKFILPCRNSRNGCDFEIVGSKLEEHEKFCELITIECPLKERYKCKWVDVPQNSFNHCIKTHPENTRINIDSTITLYRFNDWRAGKDCHIVLPACKETFCCIVDINKLNNGLMRFHVEYLGLKAKAKNYEYQLVYYNLNDIRDKIRLHGVCEPFGEPDETQFLLVSYDKAKKFTKRNSFTFTISITPSRS